MPTRPDTPLTDTPEMVVVQEMFDQVPLLSFFSFEHIATGSTADTMRLQWINNDATLIQADKRPPIAALIVRAVEVGDETGNPGNIRPAQNFDYDGRTGEVLLYEPEGLTADTKYTLTVMFVG